MPIVGDKRAQTPNRDELSGVANRPRGAENSNGRRAHDLGIHHRLVK